MAKIVHTKDYRVAREEEYPSIGEQLDAIYKALKSDVYNLPKETLNWINTIDKIKEKYPKNS